MKINLRFKRIQRVSQRISVFAGENMFVSFLSLLIVAILISIFVFYQYAFLANSAPAQPQLSQTVFQEQQFSKTLEGFDTRAVKFREIDFKQYPNIFLFSTSTTATTTGLTE